MFYSANVACSSPIFCEKNLIFGNNIDVYRCVTFYSTNSISSLSSSFAFRGRNLIFGNKVNETRAPFFVRTALFPLHQFSYVTKRISLLKINRVK